MRQSRKRASAVEFLPLSSLVLGSYQRRLIPAKVKDLVRNWKPDLGIITVSIRGGKAYVVDGQHRVVALRERGHGDAKIRCDIYRGLTEEEEAQKFLDLNDAKSVSPTDRYEAGLIANDPVVVGVRDVLARHGLAISRVKADGYVQCVSAVLAIYERDPALLDDVCSMLAEAWGVRATAFERVPVAAMGLVLGRFNGEIDRAAFVKKMAKYRGGPAALAGDARGLKEYKGGSLSRAAATIMIDAYNRGRRSGALSPL